MELKIPLPQCPSKEPVVEVPKIELPAALAQVMMKMTERKLETSKMTSSKPFPWRSTKKKKKKEPTPEPSSEKEEEGWSEELDEEELASSSEKPESEEEEVEPSTPIPEKKKLKTQTSNRKKSTPIFKTLVSFKKPTKTPKNRKSSQKKPKKK